MSLSLADVPELRAWLVGTPHTPDGGITFTGELVQELQRRGASLARCSLSLTTKHPEVFWRNLQWHAGEEVKVLERQHETLDTPFYTSSPIAALRKGAAPIRVRLTDGPLPYPVCEDLRAAGCTDYYAQGLHFANGDISYASWATRVPEGFAAETLRALDELMPALARRVELESAYHATRALLEVYLGRNAARRVLAGATRRGAGERIEAAIWFCDLRGFTAMSDRMPAEDVVATLDAYFEVVAGTIAEHGGEVLKFVGDAILAIFPVAAGREAACRHALLAATESLDAIRSVRSVQPLEIGIALHLGSVLYGNIGARGRLDFTVISAAVNEACRLESLCKELGTPLTLSEAFAAAVATDDVVDLGEHALKGVTARLRVFTLRRHLSGRA